MVSSRDELGAVLKLAGIRAKPGQVEQAWSALRRPGETVRTTDLRPPGRYRGGGSDSSGGGRGRLAVKLALAETFLEPPGLLFSICVAAAAAMVAVAVVVVVTEAVVVVFCSKPGSRTLPAGVRCADGYNGSAGVDGGKGRADRFQKGFDGS